MTTPAEAAAQGPVQNEPLVSVRVIDPMLSAEDRIYNFIREIIVFTLDFRALWCRLDRFSNLADCAKYLGNFREIGLICYSTRFYLIPLCPSQS